MSVVWRCTKCSWIGANSYMGKQFDKDGLCAKCQNEKVVNHRKRAVRKD